MQETGAAIGLLAEALRFVSAAALGIFVGAMLTEGLVLLPYWRTLPPAEFFSWYAANDARLLAFFGPLTAITVLSTAAAAGISSWLGHPARWYVLGAAVLSGVVVSMFPLYFQRANASFASAGILAGDLGTALARWAAWHWVRTGLGVAALTAALLALSRPNP